jgi:phage-related protein
MPHTTVSVFRAANGEVPLDDWLGVLERRFPKAYDRALERILQLEAHGHELKMPHSKFLRDGIHELRWRVVKVQYRILYFFHGKCAAVLSHGITKEDEVPPNEIDLAVKRKRLVASNPTKYLADFEA